MSEDPSRGSADRLNFNSVETCSSGVGSDYSERTQSQDELAVPDIPLEAQERGQTRKQENIKKGMKHIYGRRFYCDRNLYNP